MHNKDDLSSWLKASAENKINQKNAWQAPLIDHFLSISKEKDFNQHKNASSGSSVDLNFQKASSSLEGCMKVYSNRVDEVSENTIKLLESFTHTNVQETKKNRKISNFLEKSTALNLKGIQVEDFYDPLFMSILHRSDEYFLLDILEPTDSGLVMFCKDDSVDVIMEEDKLEEELEILPICDTIKEYENMAVEPDNNNTMDFNFDNNFEDDYVEIDQLDNVECDNVNNFKSTYPDTENISNTNNFDADCYTGRIDKNINAIDRQIEIVEKQIENPNIFHSNPFGYYKGWAGPSHWKTEVKPPKKKINEVKTAQKTKQRSFIDFTAPVDYNLLNIKAETVISKERILERRKNKNFLPEDHSYEIKDLYRFMIKDKYFSRISTEININADIPFTLSKTDDVFIESNNNENIEIDQAFDMDGSFRQDNANGNESFDGHDLSFQIEHSLKIDDSNIKIKYARVPKKVDIKKLKENISKILTLTGSKQDVKLSHIISEVPRLYEKKDGKDISPHFCLISLLHLANETNLNLTKTGNDVSIAI